MANSLLHSGILGNLGYNNLSRGVDLTTPIKLGMLMQQEERLNKEAEQRQQYQQMLLEERMGSQQIRQQSLLAAQQKAQQTRNEQLGKEVYIAAQALINEPDMPQDKYDQIREELISKGVDPNKLPPKPDLQSAVSYSNTFEKLYGIAPKDVKPVTRTVKRGTEDITEEYDAKTGTWTVIGRGPRWNPKDEGPAVNVKLADGTIITAGTKGAKGGQGTQQTGLTVKGQGEIEKGLLDATEGLSDTLRIQKSFDPSFATIGGQWEGYRNKVKDKLGYKLTPDEQTQFGGFTGYRAEAGRVFANTLKKLSGTAVTEPEMKRQEVYLINPGNGIFDGDSPSQVQTKIDKFTSFQRNAIARLNYIRKNGFSIRNAGGDTDFAKISLDRMPGIIKGYGQNLAAQLMKQNNWSANDPRLIQAVQAGVAEHFGLVQ